MRAIFSGTSSATRTGSKRDPGALSSVDRIVAGSILSSVPSRWATSWRLLNGRSAGMIFTAQVATFVTSRRPLRS